MRIFVLGDESGDLAAIENAFRLGEVEFLTLPARRPLSRSTSGATSSPAGRSTRRRATSSARAEARVDLTSSEFDLLLAFLRQPGQALSRGDAARRVERPGVELFRPIDRHAGRATAQEDRRGSRPARSDPLRARRRLCVLRRAFRTRAQPAGPPRPEARAEAAPVNRGEQPPPRGASGLSVSAARSGESTARRADQRRPQTLDLARRDAFDDDDDPGRVIRVRPALRATRRVKDVLDAVDQDRRLRPVDEREQPFEAQQPRPEHRAQRARQKLREGARVDRLGGAKSEGPNSRPRSGVARVRRSAASQRSGPPGTPPVRILPPRRRASAPSG